MKEANQAAEWIFSSGTIWTLESETSTVEALAVADGRIIALGSRQELEALRGPATQSFDLTGRVLLPAFVDHHLHLLNMGTALLWAEDAPPTFVDLSALTSPTDIGARLAQQAASLPADTWILGQGWSQGAWGSGELPDHRELTSQVPEHPVFLTRVCAHAAWLNARALQLAGIDRTTVDPEGGSIRRQPDGEPSGVLLERAIEPVTAMLPPPSDAFVMAAFRRAVDELAKQGVTEVFDAGFLALPGIVDLGLDLERYLELLVRTDREQPLAVRVNLMVPGPSDLSKQVMEDPTFERDPSPRVRITHLKLFMDGALGSRGGLLSHPYADDPATHGVRRMTSDELYAAASAALEGGLDVATHAIGDQAITETLEVYEKILSERPDIAPARLRLEHFSYAQESDFARAASLGILLSVQPNFVLPDDDGVAMEDARLGTVASERAYAWRRLVEDGAQLALGSDYFTRPFAPLFTYFAAATRKNPAGLPPQGWHPAEKLDRFTALKLATTVRPPTGASAERGRLAVGSLADLMVLSADPLSIEEGKILETSVDATFLAGQPTYLRSSDD